MSYHQFFSGTLAATIFAFSVTSAFAGQKSIFEVNKEIYKSVYPNEGETFFTGCRWKNRIINLNSCGLSTSFSKYKVRHARLTQIGRVIPPEWLLKKEGVYRPCAIEAKKIRRSPVAYCKKHDDDFLKAYTDMVNLKPVNYVIYQEIKSKPFIHKGKEPNFIKKYTGNKVLSIYKNGIIPDKSIMGDIARIAFYMHWKYKVKFTKDQKNTFVKWGKQDPISEEEKAINIKIRKIQGWANPYIDNKH